MLFVLQAAQKVSILIACMHLQSTAISVSKVVDAWQKDISHLSC